MPRARWLKPEFFTDKKVAQMSPVTALVYQALWCWADDGGTAQADPDVIKAQSFYRWNNIGVPEISEALRHLSGTRTITLYTVGDDQYAVIRNWSKHQSVHKPSKFRYPKQDHTVTPNSEALLPHHPGTSAEIPTSYNPRLLESYNPELSSSAREHAGQFVAAANKGLAEHIDPKRRQLISRITVRHETTEPAATALLAYSIPPDDIRRLIYEVASTCRPDGPVSTLNYFVAAVKRKWDRERAKADAAAVDIPKRSKPRLSADAAKLM